MRYIPVITILLLFGLKGNTAIVAPKSDQAPLSEQGQIIMMNLMEDIGIKYDVAITDEIKTEPTPSPPTPTPTFPEVTPTPKPAPVMKEKTAGQKAIEQAKELNRAAIQKKEDEDKKNKIYERINQKNASFYDDLHKQKNQTLSEWKKQIQTTRTHWKEKQKEFLSMLPFYKENLFDLKAATDEFSPSLKPRKLKALKKGVRLKTAGEYLVIPHALDIPIKDQGKRPTCSAFAGARALETLLAANNLTWDLSEQFIYWASKPKCKNTPCSNKGSWIGESFRQSQQSTKPDIPQETSCPYQINTVTHNETQTPLPSSCMDGKIKLHSFYRPENYQGILKALSLGHPVIAGFQLSPNFYFSKGFITNSDASLKGIMDSHANGHALLLIGYIKLPPERLKQEGEYCLLTANSWGEGWATGGFGCLSERWYQAHHIKNALLAVDGALIY